MSRIYCYSRSWATTPGASSIRAVQSQRHIRWSQGGVPRAQARERLLRSEPLALALIAEQQSWLLVGDEAVAVLRRCAGWHCQGHETLIFAPEISISDHYGYRAADWPTAQREVARQGRTNICLGSNIR